MYNTIIQTQYYVRYYLKDKTYNYIMDKEYILLF